MKKAYIKPATGTIELWGVAAMMAISTGEPQSDHNDSKKFGSGDNPFDSSGFWKSESSSSSMNGSDITF
jgi:hypothetical protein